MYTIFGFYKFKKIALIKEKKHKLEIIFSKLKIRGSLIISKEGLNGSISGKLKEINTVKNHIKRIFGFNNFDSHNLSKNKFQIFNKLKIKIKKEVVPMGINLNKSKKGGKYVLPPKWNRLIQNQNTLLIDARKPFEYNVGTFKGAINPKTDNFRNFPKFLDKLDKKKSIAMFCTGGIRCEKASVYLKKKGFKNVFQLKGGVINYLKKIKKSESLWKGECFVFDNRVSVKHNLSLGTYSICSGCRKPLSIKEKKSIKYEEGVSCSKCRDKLSDKQLSSFRMRQKQVDLAKRSGKTYKFQKEF